MFGPGSSKLAGLPFLSVAQPAAATSDPIRCLSCPAGGLTAQHAQQPTPSPLREYSTCTGRKPAPPASTRVRDTQKRRLSCMHLCDPDPTASMGDYDAVLGPVRQPRMGEEKTEGIVHPLPSPVPFLLLFERNSVVVFLLPAPFCAPGPVKRRQPLLFRRRETASE
jgi:hypothetical protein